MDHKTLYTAEDTRISKTNLTELKLSLFYNNLKRFCQRSLFLPVLYSIVLLDFLYLHKICFIFLNLLFVVYLVLSVLDLVFAF